VQIYMAYLLERGTKDTAKEYMALDREVHGPASVAAARTGGTFAAPPTAPADAQPAVPPPGQQPTPDQAAASAQAYAAWQQHQSPVNGGPVA
jgi:hypothetical protein